MSSLVSTSSAFSASSSSAKSLSTRELISQMPHALWHANQMASSHSAVISSGYDTLDMELPDSGWPASSLTELLLRQPGIGELHLLLPTLSVIAKKRRIALVQPPHLPQISAWVDWGLPHESLLWIKTTRTSDALWAAEQILRNGSCGALLFWLPHARTESLRRLQLAAQGADIVFWMMRPLAAAQDSSPAPLRLGLRPARGGIEIDLVKRRGPRREDPLYLQLDGVPEGFSKGTATKVSRNISNNECTQELTKKFTSKLTNEFANIVT